MSDHISAGFPPPGHAELRFGRFRLAGPHGPLRSAGAVIELPRKPLALLWALVSRAGEVVTKEELLATVWPRVVVTEGAIAASLRDLRRALGDDARQPRFIATSHRIGYRFIAEVTAEPSSTEESPPQGAAGAGGFTPLVGREAERARLHDAFSRAMAGHRQLVFVSGEAGIGKSSLVESFLAPPPARGPGAGFLAGARVGHGQCIEHYGAAEPYLPLFEAITRLCQQPGGDAVLAALKQHAPSWLAQLPGLAGEGLQTVASQAPVSGSVQRMLREVTDAIDAAARDRPLVLVLEDLHWSDRSTVDWLAMLARRREPARLLVVATCRLVELIVNDHPLKRIKQELLARSAASEITLSRLAPAEVQAYLALRLPSGPGLAELGAAVYRRSQGHPLFMVHMADDLSQSDGASGIDEASVPCGVSDLIGSQLERLAPEHLSVLEAASVAGSEFAAASVGAGLELPAEEVEQLLETLAGRQQFIESRGLAEWPDGTVSGRYRFGHDLYRENLYRKLGALRRVRLHARIGRRLATAYGARSHEVAAELALHFENAREPRRAARHCHEAGEKALQRYASQEALVQANKGLALLELAGTNDDDPLMLQLLLVKGSTLLATLGYAAAEVEATYTRALAMAIRLGDSAAIGPALSGLYNLHLTRASFARVAQIGQQVLTLVAFRPDPVLSMLGHNVRGSALMFVGHARASLDHAAEALRLHDPERDRLLAATYGEDPALASHHFASLACWITGRPDDTAAHLAAGFERAEGLRHPFGEAQMLWMQALISMDDGDFEGAALAALRLTRLCTEHGFPLWLAGGEILQGGALAAAGRVLEGQALVARGLQAWRGAGIHLILPHALAVSAQVQALAGGAAEGLHLLDEALLTATRTGERWYEPELHRLRGEMVLRLATPAGLRHAQAQRSFESAIASARELGASLLEARACASLASLVLQQGRAAEAVALLQQARKAIPHAPGSRDMKRVEQLLERTHTPRMPAVQLTT